MEKKCYKCKKSMPFMEKVCPVCQTRQVPLWVTTLVLLALIFWISTLLQGNNTWDSTVKQNSVEEKKSYNFIFIEENKQIAWECSRSEWVYQVPDTILKEDIEPILRQIYNKRYAITDRTNISLYTETAIKNINKEIIEVSIWFLNDGFNCDSPRNIVIKDNWNLYQSSH